MIINENWNLEKLLEELHIEISAMYKSLPKGRKMFNHFHAIEQLETYFNILNVVKKELDKKQNA